MHCVGEARVATEVFPSKEKQIPVHRIGKKSESITSKKYCEFSEDMLHCCCQGGGGGGGGQGGGTKGSSPNLWTPNSRITRKGSFK